MESVGNRGIGDVFDWAKANQQELAREVFGDIADQDATTESIVDMLRSCNHPENVQQDHTRYMNLARIGSQNDYVGVDWLRWWYQRNLIIYVNLTRLVESPDDRILLLIGAGHVYLVSQFLKESGLFEVESAYSYLAA